MNHHHHKIIDYDRSYDRNFCKYLLRWSFGLLAGHLCTRTVFDTIDVGQKNPRAGYRVPENSRTVDNLRLFVLKLESVSV